MTAPFTWTPEIVADVVKRYHAGETPSTIAATYGVSRNRVNAKLDRLGELRRRQPATPTVVAGRVLTAPPLKPKAAVQATNVAKGFIEVMVKRDRYAGAGVTAKNARAAKLVVAGRGAVMVCPPGQAPRAAAAVGAFEPLPGSTPRPFLKRGSRQCRWPVGGEGADLLACCEPADGNYCPTHKQAAHASEKAKARLDEFLGIRRAMR